MTLDEEPLPPPAAARSHAEALSAALASDLEILGACHSNCLLIGPDAFADDALVVLGCTFQSPVTSICGNELRELPATSGPGTVVIRGVSELTDVNQARLVEWLSQAAGRLQVVASSTEPLWPLVQAGRFLESLYYRLNVITLVRTEPAPVSVSGV
jgi:hypothetical protein